MATEPPTTTPSQKCVLVLDEVTHITPVFQESFDNTYSLAPKSSEKMRL